MAHRRREVLHRLCSFGGRLSKGSNRAAAGCDAQHRGEDVEDMRPSAMVAEIRIDRVDNLPFFLIVAVYSVPLVLVEVMAELCGPLCPKALDKVENMEDVRRRESVWHIPHDIYYHLESVTVDMWLRVHTLGLCMCTSKRYIV